MKMLLKNLVLFAIFGAIYFCLECFWKGTITHWSMFIVSGLIGVCIGAINEVIPWKMALWKQALIGTAIATIGEGLSGLILNVWLQLGIWNYSNAFLPFFWGQCCVPFCCAWFGLSIICIVLDDWIRWKWFDEDYPEYT